MAEYRGKCKHAFGGGCKRHGQAWSAGGRNMECRLSAKERQTNGLATAISMNLPAVFFTVLALLFVAFVVWALVR